MLISPFFDLTAADVSSSADVWQLWILRFLLSLEIDRLPEQIACVHI